jgi:hypothetical protein
LAILRRQEKATKLRECQCSNNEMLGDFFCSDIKRNMDELCRDDEDEFAGISTTEMSDDFVTTEFEEIDNSKNEIDVDEIPSKSKGAKMNITNLPVIFALFLIYFRL